MLKNIDLLGFEAEFSRQRPDNFSAEGLALLFAELEDVEPEYRLDVIGLCADFAEVSAEDFAARHNGDIQNAEHATALKVRQFLSDRGWLVGETAAGTFVYRQCD